MKTYEILKPITRRSDGRDFFPPSRAELELTAEEERALIERGVIRKVGTKLKQEASDDGKV